jgi:2-keto-4-pentenoate hydratase/2-oxohepta-3-ene-1,7-dioic acid hydratase in catechol pathway/regulator of RNase E activity RraA
MIEETRTALGETGVSEHPLGLRPTKILAVHLNYRSRAEERGRMPRHPSYFLKPPSSLAADGAAVIRPQGCELLNCEGELAAVIGARARHVAPEDALAHVAYYSAANDFGLYDMRAADRGSNLFAKGQDGYTPVGPALIAPSDLDEALTLRTYVNGLIVQEDSTANLIFPIAQLIADLSRFVTLEPGDIILTGTPANSVTVQPGDLVEVEIDGIGRLRNQIVEATEPIAEFGAMPALSGETRALALGSSAPRPAALTAAATAALRSVSTATLTVQLRSRGIRDTFIAGLRPARPDLRLLGYAYTLRYVPVREDLPGPLKGELNEQKLAVETIGDDEVLVIEARGELGAGTIGDILVARAGARGASGIVTDGAVRDSAAIAALDIPTYYRAPHASVLGLIHYPLERNVPISCGGVLVLPGDVLVGDEDGVIVLPAALAEEIAHDALRQEQREAWALERVKAGESVREVYPIAPHREAEFERWLAEHEEQGSDALPR